MVQRSSEQASGTQRTTRRHIPEEDTLQNHRCENLKSYMAINIFQLQMVKNFAKFFVLVKEYL
jgi:hypothetical protein